MLFLTIFFKLFYFLILFRAGYKLTVIDASDKDWWRGNCFGSIGVFPSTYVTKLGPREKPLQLVQSVNINSIHGDGLISLLRDQVSDVLKLISRKNLKKIMKKDHELNIKKENILKPGFWVLDLSLYTM